MCFCLKIDLKKILSEIKDIRCGKIAPLYLYGTENICKYYSKIDLKDKTVLTIAGSGDQAVNAYYFGAKEVVCFDINKLSKHMLFLKIEAIKNLEYSDFIQYFGNGIKEVSLKYEIYDEFRSKLPKDTKEFFDLVYAYFKNDGKKLFKSELFLKRELYSRPKNLCDQNYYLRSEKDYLLLKKRLGGKKIKFINADILNLRQKIQHKFDIINISNIPNFIFKYFKQDYNKLKDLFVEISKLLNKNGVIIWYTYAKSTYPSKVAKMPPPFTYKKNIKYLLMILNFKSKFYYLKTVHLDENRKGFDRAIILQK
jgi:hypothetical protein